MQDKSANDDRSGGSTDSPFSIPAEELHKYTVGENVHSMADIVRYVESETGDEVVQHAEKVKEETVLGKKYEIWDVTTDRDRWWVITNLTNLYSRRHFHSLDFTLSYHIGSNERLMDRSNRADATDRTPFDEVFRREDQAERRHEAAVEAEEYQAVGMLLRESLISLIVAMQRRVSIPGNVEAPRAADFQAWTDVLVGQLCGGSANKELRQHLKSVAKGTWQLVNWLTHARNATRMSSSIAVHSCQTVIGHFIQILERGMPNGMEGCPVCGSRNTQRYFDPALPPDGQYYNGCSICNWTDHPNGDPTGGIGDHSLHE